VQDRRSNLKISNIQIVSVLRTLARRVRAFPALGIQRVKTYNFKPAARTKAVLFSFLFRKIGASRQSLDQKLLFPSQFGPGFHCRGLAIRAHLLAVWFHFSVVLCFRTVYYLRVNKLYKKQ
jgi:hypothetical protein